MSGQANTFSSAPQQSGISLIELLIAVLVLLLGMMGYITSLNYSLKSVRQSLFATQASAYAYNIMELARVFPTEFRSVQFDPADGITEGLVDCGTITANCTPTQMVSYQLYLISCGMNLSYHPKNGISCERSAAGGNKETVIALPNGELNIADIATPVTISGADYTRVAYSVRISWDDFIAEWDASTRSWVPPDGTQARQSFEIESDDFVVAVP